MNMIIMVCLFLSGGGGAQTPKAISKKYEHVSHHLIFMAAQLVRLDTQHFNPWAGVDFFCFLLGLHSPKRAPKAVQRGAMA